MPCRAEAKTIRTFRMAERGWYLCMKKKITAAALLVICLMTAAYGTLAYFTYEETATNVITASALEIDLEEWSASDDGTLVPFEDIDDVMPGTKVSKIVRVRNTGEQPAWIRVAVTKSVTLAEGREGEIDLSLVTMDLNTVNWTERDGYYYYVTPLAPGKTTEPLFTTVSFSEEMSNLYQHSKAVIAVSLQATQTVHNGDTVFEASGWPVSE